MTAIQFGRKYNAPNVDELLAILQKDCAKWLEESQLLPVYRGSKMVSDYEDFIKIKNRPHKQDPDVPPTLQKKFDSLLESQGFGALLRNSTHVINDLAEAQNYGRVFVIFPIGNYEITWSPVVKCLMGSLYYNGAVISTVEKLVPTYRNSNLIDAIFSGNEILIKCNYYYKIDFDLWCDISKHHLKASAEKISKKIFLP